MCVSLRVGVGVGVAVCECSASRERPSALSSAPETLDGSARRGVGGGLDAGRGGRGRGREGTGRVGTRVEQRRDATRRE